jgi:alkanesulfonate monooxygenase SsuD/methylene tetrahydromethanopterin reductase-like flavin-dependent oxidoreductase (luciferase family)
MRFGFVLPGGTVQEQLDLAILADEAGWDGVFVWEAAYGFDAWSLLTAMAMRTSRVRLGTMLTPLPWRRPWKLASQVATLDQLSDGRAILAVGVGAVDTGLGHTGEVTDLKERAALLDEGLDVIDELWRGELAHSGDRFELDLTPRTDIARFRPVQQPRPPIWVVGKWPHQKSMRRVARCDGWIAYMDDMSPAGIAESIEWLRANGAPAGFDVITEGETPRDDPTPWANAGCTWWLETRWGDFDNVRVAESRERIAAGPPTV